MSTHTVRLFNNEDEVKIKRSRINVLIGNDTIVGNFKNGFFTFPIIDSTKEFRVDVEVNDIKFTAGPFKSWCLNNGARLTFGKLTKLDDLLSVAKYSGEDSTDSNWSIHSKRFFILDHAYTIDIENVKDVRELQYFILNPNSKGLGVTLMTQKITKRK